MFRFLKNPLESRRINYRPLAEFAASGKGLTRLKFAGAMRYRPVFKRIWAPQKKMPAGGEPAGILQFWSRD
jgi:hypothetical protein